MVRPFLEKKIALYTILIGAFIKKRQISLHKKKWIAEWLKKREQSGSSMTLLQELQDESETLFVTYLRMDVNSFYTLLAKVEPYIKKQDTNMRQAIPSHARLEATLRFFATGSSYTQLQFHTRISKQSLSIIIPEVCKAIYEALKEDYLKVPESPEEWMRVAQGFHSKWNFPNCIGALDGKHIQIRQPPGTGSYYFNYKQTYSIVLLAACDANLEFLYVDIGTNGRVSDGGVWQNSTLCQHIINNTAGLPADKAIEGSDKILPYVFVADNAFPLQKHIMKPYPHQNQTNRERVFSYRLSRARRTIENAFGILAKRFTIFLAPINLQPIQIESIVLACTVLHNFLRRDFTSTYTPQGSLDSENFISGNIVPGDWHESPDLLGLQRSSNSTTDGKNVRIKYMEYFNKEGAVPWQYNMINV